jgi:DNA-binding response OmpR family regulator
VVEDDPDLAEALARGLRRDGYAVDIALKSYDADFKLRTAAYDMICHDWNLPYGTGLDLCRDIVSGDLPLFAEPRPSILMLTARDDVADRVSGLDSGADDYLVKPFAFAELSARVRALLRREVAADPVLEVGPLSMNPARFEITRDGQPLTLTSKEFSLLHYLMLRPGEVFSQEHLLEHVWDEMADPLTNVVRVTLSNLRKKVGEPQLIETVPGRGYRLMEP